MLNFIFYGDVPYLKWPDLNYFPLNDSQGEGLISRRFENAMSRVVIPIISAFGIVGNVFSVVLLIRKRLTKSSSWLVLALAVADTFYLVGTNNIALYLYTGGKEGVGFWYPEPQARALYYAYQVQLAMDLSGKVVSMMMPSLITFDRLVAVLTPFRYSRIMSVGRVRAAIFCLAAFSVAVFVFFSLKFDFRFALGASGNARSSSSYQRDAASSSNNSTDLINSSNSTDMINSNNSTDIINSSNSRHVGMIVRSAFLDDHYAFYRGTVKAVVFIYGPAPLLFTIVGCFAVGYQIRRQGKKFSSAAFVPPSHQQNQARLPPSALYQFLKKLQSQNWFGARKSDSWLDRVNHLEATQTANQDEQLYSKNETGARIETISDTNTEAEAFTAIDGPENVQQPQQGDQTSRKFTGTRKVAGRTTRTLLSVCSMYCVANVINFVVLYIFTPDEVTFDTGVYVEMSRKLVLVLNSACNFLFYVGLNKHYTDGYWKLCLTLSRHK